MRPASLLLAGLCAIAAPVAGIQVLEKLQHVPQGWTKTGPAEPHTLLHLRLNLVQEKQKLLDQIIVDVATPGHPMYGKHLSYEELKDITRPSVSASQSIIDWLTSSGVDSIQDDGDWINFDTTVFQAENMLNTKFYNYKSDENNVQLIRTLWYSVPDALVDTIYMIQPTTRFGQIRPQSTTGLVGHSDSNNNAKASCNKTIIPRCLRDLYNIHGPGTNTNNGFLGITGFLGQYPRYNDLESFEKKMAVYALGSNFSVTTTNGGLLDPKSESFEANADIEYGIAIGYPVQPHFYSTAGRGPLVPDQNQLYQPGRNEPYTDFLRYMLRLPDDELPHTLSTSYAEDEQSVPERYSRAVCSMFAQLGVRGVSVIFSSGDTGPGSACQTNDGRNKTRFNPIFPAACPYVTSVGGTHHINPEQATHFSSGGFSDRFWRPKYQDKAVSAYLKILGDQWKGFYNREGRGFPDVAAQSKNFMIVDDGEEYPFTGTSNAAPTFAGIVAKLNSARIEAGMSPLGFLNPWIYSTAYTALNDITVGGSKGCTGYDSAYISRKVPFASWNATKGWDPVTGYGTPNFQKLLRLAVPDRYDP